jgi:uncharacterized membrane protein YuzA (DUF378 family)
MDLIAAVLLIVGGLNWGLVALAEFDLVATVFGLDFGQTNPITRVVYALVGLSAVYIAAQLKAIPQRWAVGPADRARSLTPNRTAA